MEEESRIIRGEMFSTLIDITIMIMHARGISKRKRRQQ
jgi:hypothetical protein